MDAGGDAFDTAQRDDHKLVVQALAGDERAWNALYHRYLPAVWRLTWSIVRNDDDAQEAAQKTFIKVSEKLAGYRNAGSLQAWILRIARNTALDYRDARKRWVMISLDLSLVMSIGAEPHDDQSIDRLMLERALAALKDEEREAFLLVKGQRFTLKQAAVIMGIEAESTVSSMVSRARRKLMTLLDDYEEARNHD